MYLIGASYPITDSAHIIVLKWNNDNDLCFVYSESFENTYVNSFIAHIIRIKKEYDCFFLVMPSVALNREIADELSNQKIGVNIFHMTAQSKERIAKDFLSLYMNGGFFPVTTKVEIEINKANDYFNMYTQEKPSGFFWTMAMIYSHKKHSGIYLEFS